MGYNSTTIGAQIVLEGETSFRAAMKSCNAEINNCRAELKLTQSQFIGNANSMAALEAKSKSLTALLEAQSAKTATLDAIVKKCKDTHENFGKKVNEAGEKLSAAKEKLEEIKNASGETSEEYKKQEEEVKNLQKEYDGYVSSQQKWIEKEKERQVQLTNSKTKENELNSELEETNRYMDEARTSADRCATSIDAYGKKVKTASEETKGIEKATEAMATAIAASGVQQGVDKIADTLRDCVDASMEAESAATGVFKTVEGTPEQLKAISDGIQELTYQLPFTITEISQVAETSGQLGIATDNVLDFTKTMLDMGASTNLSADTAATSLAKFAGVTQMLPENYSRLGSVIVDLGNNFRTTEADIVNMGTGMASAAHMAGFTQPQIMALSAAISSAGIEAEAGSTAASKLIQKMQLAVETGKGLEDFARVAGVSAEDFSRAWGENAAGALTMFIRGLGDTDRLGQSATLTLNNMGLTETRLSNAIRALTNDVGTLESAFSTADRAWSENTALVNEANKRYQTSESRMQMVKNAATGLKVAVGNALTPVLKNAASTGGDILKFMTEFVEEHPEVVRAITAIVTVAGVLTAGVVALTAAIKILNIVAESSLGVWGLVAAAVSAVVAGLIALCDANDDAVESYSELMAGTNEAKKAFEDAGDAYEKSINSIEPTTRAVSRYIDELKSLESQSSLTRDEQSRYNIIIGAIKKLVPELNIELDEQTGLLKDGADALREQTEQWKKNAEMQAKSTALADKYKAIIDAQAAGTELYNKLTTAQEKVTEAEAKRLEAAKQIVSYMGQEASSEIEYLDKATEIYEKEFGFLTNDLIVAWEETGQATAKAQDDLEYYGSRVRENRDTVRDLTAEYENFVDGVDDTVESTRKLSESQDDLGDSISATHDKLLEEAETLKGQYSEAFDSAREKIEKATDVHEGFAEKSEKYTKKAADNVLKNMEDLNKGLEDYAVAYQKASDMGYDKEFLSQFEDFSPENLAILNDLIAETPEGVEHFNQVWKDFEGSKDTYASSIASVETDFKNAMQGILDKEAEAVAKMDMRTDTAKAASDFANGFIGRMRTLLPSFYNIGYEGGRAVVRGFNAGQDAHSPARETMKSADYFAEGFIQRLNQRQRDMQAATLEAAQLAVGAMYSFKMPQMPDMPQQQNVIDPQAIRSAVRDGMREANVTVAFDYRGFSDGKRKYEQ